MRKFPIKDKPEHWAELKNKGTHLSKSLYKKQFPLQLTAVRTKNLRVITFFTSVHVTFGKLHINEIVVNNALLHNSAILTIP